jgi:hypothetical protein
MYFPPYRSDVFGGGWFPTEHRCEAIPLSTIETNTEIVALVAPFALVGDNGVPKPRPRCGPVEPDADSEVARLDGLSVVVLRTSGGIGETVRDRLVERIVEIRGDVHPFELFLHGRLNDQVCHT